MDQEQITQIYDSGIDSYFRIFGTEKNGFWTDIEVWNFTGKQIDMTWDDVPTGRPDLLPKKDDIFKFV